jgi:hypothetical protein
MTVRPAATLTIMTVILAAASAAEAQRPPTQSRLITEGKISKADVESVNGERERTLASLQEAASEDEFRKLGWTVEEAYYGFLTTVAVRFASDEVHTHEYRVGYIAAPQVAPPPPTVVEVAQQAQRSFDFDLLLHEKQGLKVQFEMRLSRATPATVLCTLIFESSALKSTTCSR